MRRTSTVQAPSDLAMESRLMRKILHQGPVVPRPLLDGSARLWRRLADAKGSVAIQFAFVALPLAVLTFGAFDYNRATVAQQHLQDALDAGNLLAAHSAAVTDTDLQTIGQPAVTSNLASLRDVTFVSSTFHANGAYIDATATATVTPIIANLWLGGPMTVTASSEVVRTLQKMEVALVLDNTGSMAQSLGSGTKISTLKTAANSLVTTLSTAAARSSDPNAVKFAVVPFSETVNVGSTYQNAAWMKGVMPVAYGSDLFTTASTNRFTLLSNMGMTWGGCVESRPAPYDIQDTAPVASTPATYFVPFFAPDEPDDGKVTFNGSKINFENNYITNDGTNSSSWSTRQGKNSKYNGSNLVGGASNAGNGPNEGCATAPVLRLTTNSSTVTTTLNSMVATGNTNVAMGLMWGWHALSPNAPFADGAAYNTPNLGKIIVLLTDGDNTNDVYNNNNYSIYTGIGYIWQGRLIDTSGVPLGTSSTGTDRMDAIDGRELALCANMKAKGIIIYTVGLGVSAHSSGLLQTCASGSDHYYNVTDVAQLQGVFNGIAGSIQNLRISK